MAVLKAICISEKKGTKKYPVERALLVENLGVKGDAHAGRWHRQVSLLPLAAIDAFRACGAEVTDGAFGENLILDGPEDLKSLPLGTRFLIGDAVLELSQIGKECHDHCAIFDKMGRCIMPVEGVFAVVIKGGEIRVGDEVTVLPPNLYRMLSQECAEADAVLAKVIAGEGAGETILFLDGIPRYFEGRGRELKTSVLFGRREEILAADMPCILTGGVEKASDIFVERIGSRTKLIVCGGGHVSLALVRLAKTIGFHVTVLEDRPLFAGYAKEAGADSVYCEDFSKTLQEISSDADTYFVIATRGHRYDEECLKRILEKPYAYVGMMGSRGRIALLKKELEQQGITKQALETLHAPIGLAINAQTPEEIAVSIAAQLILQKNSVNKSSRPDPAVLEELCKEHPEAVLCTIVSKRGSAPRAAGTRMLVTKDARVLGTIGGGCMEAEVTSRSRELLASAQTTELLCVNLTPAEAEKEGLVCGGVVEVFLEKV